MVPSAQIYAAKPVGVWLPAELAGMSPAMSGLSDHADGGKQQSRIRRSLGPVIPTHAASCKLAAAPGRGGMPGRCVMEPQTPVDLVTIAATSDPVSDASRSAYASVSAMAATHPPAHRLEVRLAGRRRTSRRHCKRGFGLAAAKGFFLEF